MTRICSFLLGAAAAVTLSACGSDERTGTLGSGGASSGQGGSSTTGTGGETATGMGGGSVNSTGGNASNTGGSANNTGGGANTATGGASSAGTGGKSTGTGGSVIATGGAGGAANNCQAGCQKLKAASCGDLATANCGTNCTAFGICANEADAYFGCVASTGVLSCEATDTLVAGCDSSGNALNLCAVCLPPANPTACGTCTQGACCPELRAYSTASDVESFDACISADTCTTQACFDSCAAMSPNAAKAYDAATTCQNKSCVKDCLCAAGANDEACLTCVKTSCCTAFGGYINAADSMAFDTCLGACAATDTACGDACATSYPAAAEAFDSLATSCLVDGTACATACAAP